MKFDRYSIRPINKGDAENYFRFISNNKKRIATYFPKTVSAINSLDSTIQFIEDKITLSEKKEFYSFVVCDDETQRIIGTVFLKDIDWNLAKGELGFFIDMHYENKGIITKAVSLLIDHCFNHFQLNKVFMRIAEENISSRRVAEKNGFTIEGTLRQDFRTSADQWIDILYYGRLKNEHNQNII